MTGFKTHVGIAAPMRVDNIDTDQIIPSREMKRISKLGLGEGLFAGWRYTYDGNTKTGLKTDFVLNQPEYMDCSILLAGRNFGCGSSREHAVWALHDFGFRVIIAESFGRIFERNCARNGLLAIELDGAHIAALEQQTVCNPQSQTLSVDLVGGEILAPNGDRFAFDVQASDREMLLKGLDYIEYSMQYMKDLETFNAVDRIRRGWAYL